MSKKPGQVQSNQLSGSIPTELGNITNLTYLYLWGNLLSGSIPAELGSLTNLTTLYLRNNQLSGDITSAMSALRTNATITTLELNSNGCFSMTDPTLVSWLDGFDASWQDGCA